MPCQPERLLVGRAEAVHGTQLESPAAHTHSMAICAPCCLLLLYDFLRCLMTHLHFRIQDYTGMHILTLFLNNDKTKKQPIINKAKS